MDTFALSGLPEPLRWEIAPAGWNMAGDTTLSVTAGPRTDLFTDPQGRAIMANSPRATFRPQGDFLLSAQVQVDFHSTFDAGALVIYANDEIWAKLCLEYSPQNQPMVVSVVTRGFSDDCNSLVLDTAQAHLRIARIGRAYAFHTSPDGQIWHLIRHFTLGELEGPTVGFSAQAPTGQGCTAVFSEVRYRQATLQDIRSGQ